MEKIKRILLLLMVILLVGCENPINGEMYETITEITDSGNDGTDSEIITDADNEESDSTGTTDSGNEETDDDLNNNDNSGNNEIGESDKETDSDNNETTEIIDTGETDDEESDYNYLFDNDCVITANDNNMYLSKFIGVWKSYDGKESFIFELSGADYIFEYQKNGDNYMSGIVMTKNNGTILGGLSESNFQIIFLCPFQFIDSNTLYLGIENKGKLFTKKN
jgi:hypothetical protein